MRALEGEERRLLRLVEADEALIRLASDKAGEVAAAIAAQAAQVRKTPSWAKRCIGPTSAF